MRRARGEEGQIFGLTVVIMVAMLGFAALVSDVGRAFYTHRSVQASADAAALAGAQKLPSGSLAVAQANQYSGSAGQKNARANVPNVATTATATCRAGNIACSPYNAIVVEQETTVDANFAKVLGFGSFAIKARAVAQVLADPMPWAIFAYSSSCDKGVRLNGNTYSIDGAVTSNGGFRSGGENIYADWATYAESSSCSPSVSGTNVDFGGGSKYPRPDQWNDWPAYYTTGDFTCTYTGKDFTFNESDFEIPEGTYCASGKFEANGNRQRGTITVIANQISIKGQAQVFRPHQNGVLFFATGDQPMELRGNAYDWTGTIFCPACKISITGNEYSVLRGLIEGNEVEVLDNSFTMYGTGPAGAKRKIALVE
jgi:hypothetical protein